MSLFLSSSSSIERGSSDCCIEWDKNGSFLSPQLGIQITLVQEDGHLAAKIQCISRGVLYKFAARICEAIGLGNNAKNWGAKSITDMSETIDDVEKTDDWASRTGNAVRIYLDEQSGSAAIDIKNKETLRKIATRIEPSLHTTPLQSSRPPIPTLVEEKPPDDDLNSLMSRTPEVTRTATPEITSSPVDKPAREEVRSQRGYFSTANKTKAVVLGLFLAVAGLAWWRTGLQQPPLPDPDLEPLPPIDPFEDVVNGDSLGVSTTRSFFKDVVQKGHPDMCESIFFKSLPLHNIDPQPIADPASVNSSADMDVKLFSAASYRRNGNIEIPQDIEGMKNVVNEMVERPIVTQINFEKTAPAVGLTFDTEEKRDRTPNIDQPDNKVTDLKAPVVSSKTKQTEEYIEFIKNLRPTIREEAKRILAWQNSFDEQKYKENRVGYIKKLLKNTALLIHPDKCPQELKDQCQNGFIKAKQALELLTSSPEEAASIYKDVFKEDMPVYSIHATQSTDSTLDFSKLVRKNMEWSKVNPGGSISVYSFPQKPQELIDWIVSSERQRFDFEYTPSGWNQKINNHFDFKSVNQETIELSASFSSSSRMNGNRMQAYISIPIKGQIESAVLSIVDGNLVLWQKNKNNEEVLSLVSSFSRELSAFNLFKDYTYIKIEGNRLMIPLQPASLQ